MSQVWCRLPRCAGGRSRSQVHELSVPSVRPGHGSSLIVGSAYHKNTNAKVERANGVISDTLRVYASGRKDDWDSCIPLAEFAINNSASSLDDGLPVTPFFIDRIAHPRLPLLLPRDDSTAGETPLVTPGGCARLRRLFESCRRQLRRSKRPSWMRVGSTLSSPCHGGRARAAAYKGAARRRRHW